MNIYKGATVQQIMHILNIEEFKEAVRSLCILDETWSSFAVATLPFPPKLVKIDAETSPVKLYPDSYGSHN